MVAGAWVGEGCAWLWLELVLSPLGFYSDQNLFEPPVNDGGCIPRGTSVSGDPGKGGRGEGQAGGDRGGDDNLGNREGV